MKPIEFPEQTNIVAENQPEYISLPAHAGQTDERIVTFCWQLTDEEVQQIIKTKQIWHQVITFGMPLQPQLLLTEKPELSPPAQPSPLTNELKDEILNHACMMLAQWQPLKNALANRKEFSEAVSLSVKNKYGVDIVLEFSAKGMIIREPGQ